MMNSQVVSSSGQSIECSGNGLDEWKNSVSPKETKITLGGGGGMGTIKIKEWKIIFVR